MKVAIVAQPFDIVPPTRRSGSLAIWAHELAARLAARHEVAIFSLRDEDQADDEMLDGVRQVRTSTDRDERTIRRWQTLQRIAASLRAGDGHRFHRHYYYTERYHRHWIDAVSRKVAAFGADAIVVINFAQFAPTLRKHNPDAHLVVMMECDWLIELDTPLVERCLRPVDAIWGCSDYIVEGVRKRFPDRAAHCHTLHNACNPDTFAESDAAVSSLRTELGLEGRRVISFVGRVTPEKGVHVLVEAMRGVVERIPEAVLLVIGSFAANPPSPQWLREPDHQSELGEYERLKTDYRRHCEALAADLGDAVRFTRRVDYQKLPAYYGLSELFVHPALWNEPFGMILAEAMGCGRAVVSTRRGGIPEIVVHGETGLLVEPDDPAALSGAIVELLQDDARREAMGREGRARVLERFTWDRTAERMDTLLARLDPEGAGAPR